MKIFAPSYYKDFHCIASRCVHTCCAGWEIDVDDDTMQLYHGLPDNDLDILSHVKYRENQAYIELKPNGRCPFLDDSGLCRIIRKYGDGAISDICYDHPRFRNYFSDHVEIGLGMSCEAAAALILSAPLPFSLCELENDEEEALPLTAEEKALLEYREKWMMNSGRFYPGHSLRQDDIHFLLSLESMLPEWKTSLHCLAEPLLRRFPQEASSRLLAYFLFRHLPSSLMTPFSKEQYISFCLFSLHVIKGIYERSRLDLGEICRQFSTEIEYSDENIDKIIQYNAEKGLTWD